MKTSIDNANFVRIWNSSTSTQQVASRTGLQRNSVQTRAWNLRRSGVKLKSFPTGRRTTKRAASSVAVLDVAPIRSYTFTERLALAAEHLDAAMQTLRSQIDAVRSMQKAK